jgi:hypothetical protein
MHATAPFVEIVKGEIRGRERESCGFVPAIASCRFDNPSSSESTVGSQLLASQTISQMSLIPLLFKSRHCPEA